MLSIVFKRFASISCPSRYVTTPIFYVNAKPHIGHLYSGLVADCIFRYNNLKYYDESAPGRFTTGTDEHGYKIQQAAALNNTPVDVYCNEISGQYQDLFRKFNINHTDFIRTTEDRHAKAVVQFWQRLHDRGYIYKQTYAGFYCVSDETFLTEAQLTTDAKTGQKVSAESGHSVEWTQEENYMFKLGKVQDGILKWLNTGNRVYPAIFERNLHDFLSEPLPDISVSRPASRVHWGITVPHDPSQTIYVWLDALVNYLTCAGYPGTVASWPAAIQVIGKDILKFHGIYWPGFLIAADMEPPRQLLCHSHWTVDGQKMSKSKNNVVNPMERADVYTVDGLRYFLLREAVFHSDGNYSDTKIKRILNAELADTFGNLLSRCCARSLNPKQIYPAYIEDELQQLIKKHGDIIQRLIDNTSSLAERIGDNYESVCYHAVADTAMAHLHLTNLFFEKLKPWELKADAKRQNELNCIILLTMESLRVTSIVLQPLIPTICKQLLDKLNVPSSKRTWTDAELMIWKSSSPFNGNPLNPNVSPQLFKRII